MVNCNICLKKVNIKKDNYVHLIDYKEGKFEEEGYYHNLCYNNAINNSKQSKEVASFGMDLLKKIDRRMFGEEDKSFTIKMKKDD